ncbi:glycosyltransferase [Lichenicola cladoniae]|uniref:Glycosyltransferase n=1 Tax=Lichenicola cladoniae TaxID=1484109 RepID=A0A6M8HV64_9PROT|nr:glycosyltransferase [Lichenicola cladoniae]NPD66174.1 glycosyltransferase [Acetobacteraceae bacterium]QKE92037.1 glycosyltransferase [Lichenicola cladoniae]
MRVIIATTQVPFVRGGAEFLADNLRVALIEAGHQAEIMAIPFKWYPPTRILDNMLACRLMKIDEACGVAIDRVIGLKFPAYLMPHPNKVMWLLHQYRAAYDTWDTPIGDLINTSDGRSVQSAIKRADDALIPEYRAIYTLSRVVSDRLKRFNNIDSRPLYHPPPDADELRPGEYGDYLLVPSRIDDSKRQHLVIEALAFTRQPVRAIFMGGGNAPDYEAALLRRCAEAGLQDRVQWLGFVSPEQKRSLYSNCKAVVFPAFDEDYGYVTLEAMLSAKPVITLSDSGGPLEFVIDGETGFICAPQPDAMADVFDQLWSDRSGLAARLGSAGLESYRALGLAWSGVVSQLLA